MAIEKQVEFGLRRVRDCGAYDFEIDGRRYNYYCTGDSSKDIKLPPTKDMIKPFFELLKSFAAQNPEDDVSIKFARHEKN